MRVDELGRVAHSHGGLGMDSWAVESIWGCMSLAKASCPEMLKNCYSFSNDLFSHVPTIRVRGAHEFSAMCPLIFVCPLISPDVPTNSGVPIRSVINGTLTDALGFLCMRFGSQNVFSRGACAQKIVGTPSVRHCGHLCVCSGLFVEVPPSGVQLVMS